MKNIFTGNAGQTCKVFDLKNMPVKLDHGGLFLCESGTAEIIVDLKQYAIRSGDMVVVFPYSVVQLASHSDHFGGTTLAASSDFFCSLQIPDKSTRYLHINRNPCISLSEEERQRIRSYYEALIGKNTFKKHPFRREIEECVMKMIVYEIAAIYLRRKPITPRSLSRNEMIFQQFVFSLFNNFHAQRTLEFYAGEQSITPRHLSMVVKRESGRTAGEWITGCTIMNIKSELHNRSISIKEISVGMNFPNPSFFSQYFKKYTGVTPKEYRNSLYRPSEP